MSSVTASEASRRARRLSARSLAAITRNVVLEFAFDATDETFDAAAIEVFALNLANGEANVRRLAIKCGSMQEDLAAKIEEAMMAVGTNVTVVVGDFSASYKETVMSCK